MAMANLNRMVAEVLLRAHQAEWGPTGSNPQLQTELTSEEVSEQMVERQMPLGHETVRSVLLDLAEQDYITLARHEPDEQVLVVQKVYPARMKRDFNLWHVAEEA